MRERQRKKLRHERDRCIKRDMSGACVRGNICNEGERVET